MTAAPGQRRRLTSEAVRLRRFTPVRIRAGYDMAEVDQLLDDVQAELERSARDRGRGCSRCETSDAGTSSTRLTSETVQAKRFTPVRFREGYDMDEVDLFLDDVQVELDRIEAENRRSCPRCRT